MGLQSESMVGPGQETFYCKPRCPEGKRLRGHFLDLPGPGQRSNALREETLGRSMRPVTARGRKQTPLPEPRHHGVNAGRLAGNRVLVGLPRFFGLPQAPRQVGVKGRSAETTRMFGKSILGIAIVLWLAD